MSDDPRHQHVEANLMIFSKMVEEGKQPPQWLMDFMARGAREFLRGGKPWQKGKGGRPKGDGKEARVAFLLKRVGKLDLAEIADLMVPPDAEGSDRKRTMRRWIEKGEKQIGADFSAPAPFGLDGNGIRYWLFADALVWGAMPLDLPRDAKQRLCSLKNEVDAFEKEMEREPIY